MNTLRALRIASLMAVVAGLAWMLTAPAAAYIGQNPLTVRLGGPSGTVSCSRDVTITARVRDSINGRAISFQRVRWSVTKSPSAADRVSPASTVTGKTGTTSVTLSFGQAAGSRTIRATVATFSQTLVVRCAGATRPATAPAPAPQPVHHPAHLPPTSTVLAAAGPADAGGFNNALLLTLVFIGTSLAFVLRRSAQR